jgi:hypothetical protein
MPKALELGTRKCLCCGESINLNITRDLIRKRFCSRSCRTKWNYQNNNDFGMKNKILSEESKNKMSLSALGGKRAMEKNGNWKGGKRHNRQGYVLLTTGGGATKSEHRMIAENILGRKLKRSEHVHHVDGDKSNNTHTNLLICDWGFHRWFHNKMSFLYQQLMFKGKENASNCT